MFGTRSTQRTYIRQTQREVSVTEKEVALFRALNPDRIQVQEAASIIKATNVELREFPSEVTLILHAKSQQLAVIKRNVNTIMSMGNAISLFTIGGQNQIIGLFNIVRDNSGDLARFALPYFEPDLSLTPPDEKQEDKVIVMSNARVQDIASIIQKFGVPEGIASDIQDIIDNGPGISNVTSVASHIFSKISKKKQDVDSSGFDFG